MMDLVNLDFVKLAPNIKTPTKATQFSVGLDIYRLSTRLCEKKVFF